MKKQLQSIGLSLDWTREFATCDPSYYKHQQKLFNDFLRAGLAEREHRKINWDPVDMTVLANEQVIDGRGWRSGALVEQREMKQWVFKISKYSQELLDALDTLDRWPDKVRLMQRNWIGRSEGMLVRFALDPATTPAGETELKIFTTRHDTLFGAKFMAIAPDHPLAQAAAAKNPKLRDFIAEAKRHGTAQEIIDTAEKLGFDTGIRAIHPFDANWKLPVYVAIPRDRRPPAEPAHLLPLRLRLRRQPGEFGVARGDRRQVEAVRFDDLAPGVAFAVAFAVRAVLHRGQPGLDHGTVDRLHLRG
jgi:leucyl-tRNA synthetase